MKWVLGIIGIAAIAALLMGEAFGIQGGPRQATTSKTDWPEKEGIPYTLGVQGVMRDSCIPPMPFDLPTRGPAAC